MPFPAEIVAEVVSAAVKAGIEPAALLAVADVESAGVPGEVVNGRFEPIIRWEGHYFDRRLTGKDRERARAEGLASPTAGAVANPRSQAARWTMMTRGVEINANAAMESASYGIGQVMGAHWKWLGYGSVSEMVNLCRSGVAGQLEVMIRYIEKAGLLGAVRGHNWDVFAKGYNGPTYKVNAYDQKLATAYARYKPLSPNPAETDHTVRRMQERLVAHGFKIRIDGIRGRETTDALLAFQKAKRLRVDGIAGSATWAALEAKPVKA